VFQPPRAFELTDQGEEACGGGVEVRGQLGDFVAKSIQL
jgi:hypothetical protein